jgi:hypothetical protein
MLHLVASRVLKQRSSGALAYIVTVVPGSALQNATTFIADVMVHQPDSAALVMAACISPTNLLLRCTALYAC